MRYLTFFFLLISIATFATDNYPKNPDIDVQHYRFDITLSDETDEIKCTATIEILLKKKDIRQIRLDLTNVSSGKGMTVSAITQNGKQLSYTHQKNELLITLANASQAGEHIQLTVSYSGVPATGLHIKPNRYNERTFFSDNWPDLTRNWLPVVDHVAEKATCEFIVTAPVRYQVVCNGLLLEETNLNATQKRTHWKQSVPISPWLYVLGVAEFAVQYVDWFDGKSIQTWVFHQDRDAGFSDFAKPTKEVLEFYSSYVGPFAYEKLANIQASSVSGGMESASAILYNEKSVVGDGNFRWKKVVIHEIAHQWFGCAVTESDWDDVWLSEGFATYFTALFIEHAYGRDEFVKEMQGARKTVFNFYKDNPTHTIVHNNLSDMSKVTSSHTYQKGAWTLHMLRSKIGDEKFEAGIKNYYRKYMNATASTKDFQHEMERVSGLDLTAFFKQWLNQGGKLTLNGTWNYNAATKEIEFDLKQTQTDGTTFSVPVEIGIFKKGQLVPDVKTVDLTGAS
ncbi:MAG TPA: M1 family metallopeptidase, partial [Cyclobacteriaceae bacterium]|nr:M1 family metallopeptidase [Cyclobacteriaceae bacterium]